MIFCASRAKNRIFDALVAIHQLLFAVRIVQEDDIEIRQVVQLAAAELAVADNREDGPRARRSPSIATREAVTVAQNPSRARSANRVEYDFGQVADRSAADFDGIDFDAPARRWR